MSATKEREREKKSAKVQYAAEKRDEEDPDNILWLVPVVSKTLLHS